VNAINARLLLLCRRQTCARMRGCCCISRALLFTPLARNASVALNNLSPQMSKGIDYSKWDKMAFDTDSSDEPTPKAAAAPAPAARLQEKTLTSETSKMSIEMQKPQQVLCITLNTLHK